MPCVHRGGAGALRAQNCGRTCHPDSCLGRARRNVAAAIPDIGQRQSRDAAVQRRACDLRHPDRGRCAVHEHRGSAFIRLSRLIRGLCRRLQCRVRPRPGVDHVWRTGVIPGRRPAASPESITTELAGSRFVKIIPIRIVPLDKLAAQTLWSSGTSRQPIAAPSYSKGFLLVEAGSDVPRLRHRKKRCSMPITTQPSPNNTMGAQ
jgi:hypothetical protein